MNLNFYLVRNNMFRFILFSIVTLFIFFTNLCFADTIVKDWIFSSSTQGWTTCGTTTSITQYSGDWWPGIVFAQCTGSDPQFVSPTFSESAQTWHKIKVRIATHGGSSHEMRVYWKRSGDSGFSETRSMATYYFNSIGQDFKTVEINVGNSSYWSGYITQIRIDPSKSSCPAQNFTFHIDSIRIQGTPTLPQPSLISPINSVRLFDYE